MKKIAILGLLAVACVAGSVSAAPSASANITATVVEPILIVNGTDLDFGTLATNGNACDAVLTPIDAGPNPGSLVAAPCVAYGDHNDSEWTIDAQLGFAYSLTLDGGSYVMTAPVCAGDNDILVDTFTANSASAVGPEGAAAGGTTWTGTGTGVADTFDVGATAHLSATQCGGLYDSVSFTITALYI